MANFDPKNCDHRNIFEKYISSLECVKPENGSTFVTITGTNAVRYFDLGAVISMVTRECDDRKWAVIIKMANTDHMVVTRSREDADLLLHGIAWLRTKRCGGPDRKNESK